MPLLTAGPSRFLGGGAKWWQVPGATCVAAYQPKGAADLATSYVNLANPGTYNATSVADPAFATATGWQFDGELAAGDLVSVALSVDTQTSTVIVAGRAISNPTPAGRFYDGTSVSPRYMIPIYMATNERAFQAGGSFFLVSGALTDVNCVMAMAGSAAYVNGVSEGIDLVANGTTITMTFGNRVGRDRTINGYIYAVAVYSSVLTAGQVAAVSAAMAAL